MNKGVKRARADDGIEKASPPAKEAKLSAEEPVALTEVMITSQYLLNHMK
jgi:hypothetical protein